MQCMNLSVNEILDIKVLKKVKLEKLDLLNNNKSDINLLKIIYQRIKFN